MHRIAWFSTIFSDRTLRSTEFSRRILSDLLFQNDITLFTGDEDYRAISNNKFGFDFEIRHYLEAYSLHHQQPFDLFCYQIEDDPRLDFSVRSASNWPGIAFLHDSTLNRVVFKRYDHTTTGLELNSELYKRFGKNSAPLGDLMVRKLPVEAFYSLYPFFFPESENNQIIARFDGITDTSNIPSHCIYCDFPLKAESCDSRQLTAITDQADNKLMIGCAIESRLEDQLEVMLELIMNNEDSDLCFNVFTSKEDVANECNRITEKISHRAIRPPISVIQYDCMEGLKSLIAGCDIFVAYRFAPNRNLPLKILYAIEQGIPMIVGSLGPERNLPMSIAEKVKSGNLAVEQIARKIAALKDPLRRAAIAAAQSELTAKTSAQEIANELSRQFDIHQAALQLILNQRESKIAEAKLNLVRLTEARQKPTRCVGLGPHEYINKAATDFKWYGDKY